MLQLAAGVRLRVDIGDLFQLQRRLQAGGVVAAPTDKEHIGLSMDLVCKGFHLGSALECLFDQCRQLQQIGF